LPGQGRLGLHDLTLIAELALRRPDEGVRAYATRGLTLALGSFNLKDVGALGFSFSVQYPLG